MKNFKYSTIKYYLNLIKINAIAESSVDINGIGMYTLGKYRKSINDEQKSKYQKLFRSYFLKSFSSRLVDYTNPKINVVSLTTVTLYHASPPIKLTTEPRESLTVVGPKTGKTK